MLLGTLGKWPTSDSPHLGRETGYARRGLGRGSTLNLDGVVRHKVTGSAQMNAQESLVRSDNPGHFNLHAAILR
jgi:hypothetical protein